MYGPEDEECWRLGPREAGETGRELHRAEPIRRLRSEPSRPDPEPSEEEVESVFRRVTASY